MMSNEETLAIFRTKNGLSHLPLKEGSLSEQLSLNADIEIRALSWKQPYCSLMLPPHNKVETRIWHTNYRGLVLMCASKQPYSHSQIVDISGKKQAERIYRAYGETDRRNETAGHAIAIGRLVDCRKMRGRDSNRCFVQYQPNLWCHVYDDVHPIFPIPWKGTQGWAKVPPEIISQIEILPTLTLKS